MVSAEGRRMATHRPAHKGQKVAVPHRGDIYLVNFDPTVGAEIQKTRPALVIQNEIGNQYSPITIVAAISSKFGLPPYPTEVVMEPEDSGLPQDVLDLLDVVRDLADAAERTTNALHLVGRHP